MIFVCVYKASLLCCFLSEDSTLEPLRPMVIDFTKLQSPAPEESIDDKALSHSGGGGAGETAESASVVAVRSPTPITVPSPR